MMILALDTGLKNCAVALVNNGEIVARISDTIGKGHAEKLIEQLSMLFHEAHISFDDVDRFAVNVGPGSFTGVRIGVSSARALSLAFKKPSIGVSSLEAMAYQTVINMGSENIKKTAIVCVMDAGRGLVYRQDFQSTMHPITPPQLLARENFAFHLPNDYILAGPYAGDLGLVMTLESDRIIQFDAPDIVSYAFLAENKKFSELPKPLYLRDADAKPQTGYALARK
ncbi:tRNA (adenosine(37)-N6)-threonylcarbamoyltransferase complex dimerization subunit type 1 TsaB [Bartonella tamiae]|uniref:Universal bacterial protein YeaZ n=1 Tax=Bartonella tamiae Th239 TaxID=1094558 RepID=J0ZRC9_9HYPH|nr:tRNA (adenosine(37)-N6)-threonylcarbamoyltransferase complex dimerization subunit type 1 TsaB [Bartonella tamiae]EJF91248.1 universal bacterial protein YeaZ [Bartonella tamiae Th239]EJF93087.1 universal bacterial protein YeaZ [Bartonella tamiae Th307]